jgi:hypothetical protein
VIAGGYLESIAGIESWPQLRCLDLDFGPHPPDLGPLAALPELELLCVRTSHKNVLDLSPLTHSRSLRVVHLDQPHAAHFQLRPLPRNGGLEVLLPPNVAAHAKGVPKESFKISRITIGKRLW